MRRATKLRSQNWLPQSFVCTVILVTMGACSGRESSLMRLVPADSCAVMTLDWSSLRHDPDLRRVIKGDAFETLLGRLGINGDSVDTVVVFSSIDGHTTSGLLLSGPFNRKKVLADLKQSGWKENSLQDHTV